MRQLGQSLIPFNFEPKATFPLDGRLLVPKYSDLTDPNSWETNGENYTYLGMIVACKDSPGRLYLLVNSDYSKQASWKTIRGEGESIYKGCIDVSSDESFEKFEASLCLDDSYINLFVASDSSLATKGGKVTLSPKWEDALYESNVNRGVSIGDYLIDAYNAITKDHVLTVLSIYEAEAASGNYPGNEGLMSVWDKTQVNKIPSLETIWNYLCQTRNETDANKCIYSGIYPYVTTNIPTKEWGTIQVNATKDTDSNGYYSVTQFFYYRGAAGPEAIWGRVIFYKASGVMDLSYPWTSLSNLEASNTATLLVLFKSDVLAEIEGLREEFLLENRITNPFFIDGMSGWSTIRGDKFFKTPSGKWLWNTSLVNLQNGLYSLNKLGAYIDVYAGKVCLAIREGKAILSVNNLRKITTEGGTFPKAMNIQFLYLVLKKGTLEISLGNTSSTFELDPTNKWDLINTSLFWDGASSLEISFTSKTSEYAEIKIRTVNFSEDTLETFKSKYSELFSYSDTLIKMAKAYDG